MSIPLGLLLRVPRNECGGFHTSLMSTVPFRTVYPFDLNYPRPHATACTSRRYVDPLQPITTGSAMPCGPVKLTSSRSCICMRRTPRPHPGSSGRNRHQPQPSFLEATRTGGGVLVVIETLATQVGEGEG